MVDLAAQSSTVPLVSKRKVHFGSLENVFHYETCEVQSQTMVQELLYHQPIEKIKETNFKELRTKCIQAVQNSQKELAEN